MNRIKAPKEDKTKAVFGYRGDENCISVIGIPNKSTTYHADIYGEIEDSSQFSEVVLVLGMMTDEDTIVLNLQSCGGSIEALDTLTHAIRKTEGNVHMVASGGCHSAASCLLLEADSFELAVGFNSLIHCGSLGNGGTLAEVNAQNKFMPVFFEKLIRMAYFGFFDDAELDALIRGQDYWLDGQEWMRRYNKRNEVVQQYMDSLEAPEDVPEVAPIVISKPTRKAPVKKPVAKKTDKAKTKSPRVVMEPIGNPVHHSKEAIKAAVKRTLNKA